MTRSHHQTSLQDISTLMQHWILKSTAQAGSGHPTSSISSVELMAGLFFGGYFHFDVDNPDHPNHDRLIFSKGHASPLLYALLYVELYGRKRWNSPCRGKACGA